MRAVCAGVRPELPEDSPGVLGELAERCWRADATVRPGFDQIVRTRAGEEPPALHTDISAHGVRRNATGSSAECSAG